MASWGNALGNQNQQDMEAPGAHTLKTNTGRVARASGEVNRTHRCDRRRWLSPRRMPGSHYFRS
jgi:hypothetical protein